MPSGTVAVQHPQPQQQQQQQQQKRHLNGDATAILRLLHQQPSTSALATYTNGDYAHQWAASHYPDDRISQADSNSAPSSTHPGENIASRPASRGASSSATPSRPTTSHDGAAAGLATASSSSASAIVVARPESSGTDGAAHPAMRHGFAEAYSSEEYLTMLEQVASPLTPSGDLSQGILHVFHFRST